MSRRRRVLLVSLAVLGALAAAAVTAVFVLTETEWGHERVRQFLIARFADALGARGSLSAAHLDGGLGGRLSADSLVLRDEHGRVVAFIARVDAQASTTGLLTGRVRITRLLLVRPFVLLEQTDSTWNLQRILGTGPRTPAGPRSTLAVVIDSAEVQEGHLLVVTPDSLPRLPPVRRDFTHVSLVLGRSRVMHPDTLGGASALHRLSMESSLPPVSLRMARGAVRWWPDSLALSLPEVRLPASHASVTGTVSWAARGTARLALLLEADTVSLADIAWISPLVPTRGGGSARVMIRNGTRPREIDYALTDLFVRTPTSALRGSFVATAGRGTSITRLALDVAPLDLDQIREIFGDSVPKKVWQGTLTGHVRGAGGPLGALRLDDVALTFTDRRARGAVSHVTLAGELDAAATPAVLHGVRVGLQDLDIRTLGAISKVADSLHGVLSGSLVLDGPMRDLRFRDLVLTHIDGAWPRSMARGEGRLATDATTDWFEATLSLDRIAPATWLRDSTTLRLESAVHGTLNLLARRDTMTIDADLRTDGGDAHFRGASLLDSARTWVRGRTTLTALDPRWFLRRHDVPALRLDGAATVTIEGTTGQLDAHADVVLDTTSRVGGSHVTLGRVRAGVDSTGFHVDTAEVQAADWRISAHGRLARTGATHDTLRFAVAFDSLGALGALVLDSAGAPMLDSLRGALSAAGQMVGSLDTLRLDADFGVTNVQTGDLTVRRGAGHATLQHLPSRATGFVTFTADSAGAAGFLATRMSLRADVADGREARIRATASSGDSIGTAIIARATRDGDSTRVSVDSLDVSIGAARWRLERAATIVTAPGRVRVDSAFLRSTLGATVSGSADLPDSGAVRGGITVRGFAPAELSALGLIAPGVDGRLAASLAIAGTRTLPRLTATATVDSVSVNGRAAPSLTATATYADRRLAVEARGTFEQREILGATASLPLDLGLRRVATRKLDDSLRITLRADSATLDGLEAVIPGVEGLHGSLTANVDVRGSWKTVQPVGTVRLRGGGFTVPRAGFVAQDVVMDDTLARDTVRLHAHMNDGNDAQHRLTIDGAAWQADGTWRGDVTSIGRGFKVADDPRLATADANWLVHLTGPLREPTLEGDLALINASLVLGQQRNVRVLRSDTLRSDAQASLRRANISSLRVFLGSNVRLRSRDANVKLSGEVELSGPLMRPYVSGEVYAERGTYRVDLGLLKRTFRVDSGTVLVAGTFNVAQATIDPPATLDIWTSYVVRRAEQDDITVRTHLTGTPDVPRLSLGSSDLGTSAAQSEIISYLIFGTPSFGVDGLSSATDRTVNAALVPYFGGLLEGVLGSVLPFFSSLQVATISGSGLKTLTTNPVDGLLNSFALTAGRQIGSDSFLNLSGGVCRGSRLTSTQSPSGWFGVSAEYKPRRGPSGVISVEPSGSPCSGLSRYQFGLDVFRDWKF